MTAITLNTIWAGALRENGHANFGAGGSGYLLQHTTIPRLSAMDRYYRGKAAKEVGTSAARLWYVDGAEVASLDEAVERLAVPPSFTDAERTFLAKVQADWIELHAFLDAMAPEVPPPASAYEVMLLLRQKGAVEVERREAVKRSFVRRSPEPAAGAA